MEEVSRRGSHMGYERAWLKLRNQPTAWREDHTALLVAISLDIDELKSLLTIAKRPTVRNWIETKIETLNCNRPVHQAHEPTRVSPMTDDKVSSSATLPTVKLTSYEGPLSLESSVASFNLAVIFSGNKVVWYFQNARRLVPFRENYDASYMVKIGQAVILTDAFQQKADMLLVMMKKKTEGKKWEQLTKLEYDEKQKRKPNFDKTMEDDPQASLMNMMKQMYEEGDDEMKRTIRKAWHEGQSKRNFADVSS
uniref:SGS domain-containing protein n=1 Tax=Angiostrongylus cantonensis TaxID=6313 RepID=A0A0K0D2K7_ANGCA